MSVTPRRTENANATRAALVSAAAELFAEQGYSAVTTGQVVEHARVTRGALYHYFSDKRALMRAAFASADHALVDRVAAAGADGADPADRYARTWRAFLDAIADPSTRNLIFVEAPAALGWQEWRELDAGRSLGLVVERLGELQAAGLLGPDRHLVTLGHLVLGALNEAGMLIASSRDPRKARREAEKELARFFEAVLV